MHGLGLSVAQMAYGVAGIVMLRALGFWKGAARWALRSPAWHGQTGGTYASITRGILLTGPLMAATPFIFIFERWPSGWSRTMMIMNGERTSGGSSWKW